MITWADSIDRNSHWTHSSRMPSSNEILDELKKIKYPGFSRDIVSFGLIKDIEVATSGVLVILTAASAKAEVVAEIAAAVERAVAAIPGVPAVKIELERPAPARAVAAATHQRPIPQV